MPSKYKNIFDKKINKYGQTTVLHRFLVGTRCSCYNSSTGYCDPQWHREHIEAPECDEEGYISRGNSNETIKAFIFPASDVTKKGFEEVILSSIGKVQNDDYAYIGNSDIDIFNLSEKDYLEFDNKKWRIKNPDSYKFADETLVIVARLELIGDA